MFLLQSPTFTKIHQYPHIIHMDLYEAKNLDNYYHYFDDNKMMLIEWGELFTIPWDFQIQLQYIDENNRSLILTKNN